ncbi:MAG TPA: lytic transglycosylase domain-containing protein [Verrucomicrobiae bacterium]|nr:lytic transglycosylase domain-containing protein [Verrucomicrobiae bacterium]
MHFTAKMVCMLAAALLTISAARGQEAFELNIGELGEVAQAAQEWASENLDEEVLKSLPEVDRDQVEKFLKQFQDQLKGQYVLDLAALKDAAKAILPVLAAHDETQPYAAWLRSRLDYFDVAEQLRRDQPAPKADEPPRTQPNPSPVLEQKVWKQQLSEREWPKGAAELVPKLKPLFAAERVPEQLVWIAEVESGFNPDARSPVGAAGLFQLMPETAKGLGLRRWPFDQRYQPEPSAQAAAKHLKRLYSMFGDWHLALAAYNAGEGRVRGLLDRNQARSFDSIATQLPAETQMYVPKVEATILRREGVALSSLGKNRK